MTEHDPGGKIRRPLPEGMGRAATFSDCGRYRYDLQRWWGEGKGTVLWIGMNPSTADKDHDDPTCQFERRYTERMGYEHYVKCNVLAWRATKPSDLPRSQSEMEKDSNQHIIKMWILNAELIVFAWGNITQRYWDETSKIIVEASRLCPNPPMCLGHTKSGAPRHPSRLGYNAEMVPF